MCTVNCSPQSWEVIPLDSVPDPGRPPSFPDVSWQCQVQCREQSPALHHTAGSQVTKLMGAVDQLKNKRRKRLDKNHVTFMVLALIRHVVALDTWVRAE